jgi:type II secretory pathway pseudopilin PulG
MRSGRRQSGFTYLTALLLVAVVGAGLAATAGVWSQTRQREKEAELQWIGAQFTQAIALYYQRTPGTAKRYPETLEDLLEDKRSVNVQRYLRKVYADPMTGKSEWGLVTDAEGGITGVFSLSSAEPIKTGNFSARDKGFENARQYSDWRFVYVPPTAAGSSSAARTPAPAGHASGGQTPAGRSTK